MDHDPVMADLDRHLEQEWRDEQRAEAEEAAAVEALHDQLLAIVHAWDRWLPVEAHNLRVRMSAAGDDLQRLEGLLELAEEVCGR